MLFLIDTNDLEAIIPDTASRQQVLDNLKQIGRGVADAPAAILIQRAERELELARQKAVEPSPEVLRIIEKNPTVVEAQKKLESLRAQLGI